MNMQALAPKEPAVRRVGDLVQVNDPKYPGTWRVAKVLQANLSLEPVTGGRGLRCPKAMVVDVGSPPPVFIYFREGQLVRWDDPKGAGILFVVIRETGDRVNIVQLGGTDDGRYYRVNRYNLTVLDPADFVLKPVAL